MPKLTNGVPIALTNGLHALTIEVSNGVAVFSWSVDGSDYVEIPGATASENKIVNVEIPANTLLKADLTGDAKAQINFVRK